MRNQVITVGSLTNSVPLQVDNYTGVVNIGIGCVVNGGGTLTFSVQYTYDDLNNPNITPTWWTFGTISGKTANADGNINFPVKYVRLNVSAYTSGSVTMTLVQARQGPGSH